MTFKYQSDKIDVYILPKGRHFQCQIHKKRHDTCQKKKKATENKKGRN